MKSHKVLNTVLVSVIFVVVALAALITIPGSTNAASGRSDVTAQQLGGLNETQERADAAGAEQRATVAEQPALLAVEAPSGYSSAEAASSTDAPPPPTGKRVHDTAAPEEIADVPGVSEDWWSAVQEQIRADAYGLTAEEAEGGLPSYQGHNPHHRFDLTFADGRAFLARSAAAAEGVEMEPPWTWGLHTTGFGYEGDIRALPAPAETAVDGNRVEYRRAALTEWYVNDERGLEQGFTIDAAPAGEGDVLVLEMAMDTDLVPTLRGVPTQREEQVVQFTKPDGNVIVLRYGDLHAYDADWRELPARMQLSGCGLGEQRAGCHLQLAVDVADAAYPLRIDPLVSVPDWTAVGAFADVWFGFSVSTAGDVNGDGYADVVVGAPGIRLGYSYGTGFAYVYHGSPAGLGDTPAWTATREGVYRRFGFSVATAGDVNGDGYADLVVGAEGPRDSTADRYEGKAYVYHGSPAGLADAPAWTAIGETKYESFGTSVATAGDVNGDGYADVVVGAPEYSDPGSYYSGDGRAYVYFGSAAGLGDTPAWSASGWTGNWQSGGGEFGRSVATAGDVNGDGYADVVVGAPNYHDVSAAAVRSGKAYVVFGSRTGPDPDLSKALTAVGEQSFGSFGFSVATAGDVNGDDRDEIIVGAPAMVGSSAGFAYVYEGHTGTLEVVWTASTEGSNDRFGYSVASAGDVDGDGFADLVVGAHENDDNGSNAGKAYVYHGSSAGLGDTPAWAALGASTDECFGYSVATAGDVDGDGFADLVVGAPNNDDNGSNAGKAYVYHGSKFGLNRGIDWTQGGENAYDSFGRAVAAAGDVNGDGFADIVVGAPNNDDNATDAGKAYVYHGSPSGLGESPDWFAVGEIAGDRFGYAVATAGDVNGDGFADLVVGAPHNGDNGTGAGKAYVYIGSGAGLNDTPDWMATGAYGHDNFASSVASAGDVNADGFADVVVGAADYPLGQGNGKAYVYHGAAEGLDETADWTATGEKAADRFGSSVGIAGDINGDGCADIIVGAWGYAQNRGKAYVYYGSSELGLRTHPDWSAEGENASDYLGWSVGTAGDVNGDGYADIIAGAWGYAQNRGKAYVYYGSSGHGLGTSPDGTAQGEDAGDYYGSLVGTAGDVNGDGYADLLVGAHGHSFGAGKSYLYRGGSDYPFDDPAWTASGATGGGHFASALGGAGDVDGDGYSDIVVGAWGHDDPSKTNSGRAYVYRGSALGLSGTETWTADGENALDSFGVSMSTAGDVDGDGYADVVIGAPGFGSDTGRAYIFYGARTGLGNRPPWTADGMNAGDRFGDSVATAGDVDGDGFADIVIGAPRNDDNGFNAGKAYTFHGSNLGPIGGVDWTQGGEIEHDAFGCAVASAGDVNGDGYGDVVIGASENDDNGPSAGKAYVYHGSPAGLGQLPDWIAFGELSGDGFGHAVATAGDVNGDGFADIVVGAPRKYHNGFNAGKAYVYHGSPVGPGDAPVWSANGEDDGDYLGSLVGTAGDVNGDGYADVLLLADGHSAGRGGLHVYHGSPLGLDAPFSVFGGGDDSTGKGTISSVANAGDVDGDGFADIVVGASLAFTESGRVYVYSGSPGGLRPDFDPVVAGASLGSHLGATVAAAGDVNGDGYGDVVVRSMLPKERVHLYVGNDGGGRSGLARQTRGDLSGKPVQPWGPSYTADSFGISLNAVDPLGRGRARLQVQACPPGVPFGDTNCADQTSEKWIGVSSDGDVELSHIVRGLNEGELYRWRARALYDSPLYSHGPWRRLMGQALEGDVRSTRLPADLWITKAMTPSIPVATDAPITYTLTYTSSGPARGVVITDVLPSDLGDVTSASSGAAITPTGHVPCCVWIVQDLEATEGGVITVTGLAQVERFVNTATIGGTSPDPDPDNNSATVQTHIPGILYVDDNANGADNGLSWANAYTDLQDALAEAKSGDQVWIAGGVYRPIASGLRSYSFHLKGGVRVHGGFAGTENWLHERDPAAEATILSGDIGTVGDPDDNVYHVVTATPGVTETAVLENVIITGGNADGNDENGSGGGVLSLGGSPTLTNVAFVGNAANQGGGIYNEGSSPTLVNVAFSGNAAETEGGGMFNLSSSPVLTNTTFSRNTANSGGGIYNADGSAAKLTNAIVWGNSPDQIANVGSAPAISDSDIQGGCPVGATCSSVINRDPQLWNPEGEDGLAGTLDDDLRIYTTYRHPSPVIDAGDSDALPVDTWDLDGDDDTSELLPLDLSGRWRLVGFTDVAATVDMGAFEATVVDVLAEGDSLFQEGEAFRMENLQLLSSDSLADALKNYANFNDGEWYYAFCSDYDRIDENGYCPSSIHKPVRNTLVDAVDLYRVAVGWPTEAFTTVRGIEIPAWGDGGRGVLSSATEIANVHLIFGNEFLVDATDYRFSTAGIPYADQIIAQELDELAQAQLQFELIMEVVVTALNEWGVAKYCTSDQFEQFGVASSLLMSTLNEIAARYYMLRQSEAALAVYGEASSNQYLHMMALADVASESDEEYLQDGGWEMLNNLSQMRERAQAIHDGLDFFGFAPDYVPLQAYEQLLVLTEGPVGDSGLLGTARDLEDQARDAQRTFDANASGMATELDNLTVELNGQLFELCGSGEDDYEKCEGGLMEQNLDALDAASRRVGLAYLRAQNFVKQIQAESERSGQEIAVELALGQQISAAELAIGKLRAVKTTDISVSSSEDRLHVGVATKEEAYIQSEFGLFGFTGTGLKAALELTKGYQHAWTWTSSTQTVWDTNEAVIGAFESLKALRQAEAQAKIEGANSAAVVRNLLLQQSEALEERQIAMAQFNKLAAEHNYLAQRRSRLLNMRNQAINRVASHNSHLLSPAYRIWRDSLTTQSNQAHALSAQFAYLTARAAEYELLTPYPGLGQIFRARTANDIRLFMDDLKVWVQALDLPGQLNRYPYTVSLARDVWGLTDQTLDPDGVLSAEDLQVERYDEFQRLLQAGIDGGGLDIWFSTTLDQQRSENRYLFSPNIWNNRIAGIGAPLGHNEGVSLNIVTGQSGDIGDLEAVLIHGGLEGGAEAFRNSSGKLVYYDPDTAVPVGYALPAALDPANTTAVLRPGINGVGAIANGALLNLSVAASNWTLRIPAATRGDLDYSQIEDIEIVLDTTGRALPDRAPEAEQDSLRLQAGLLMEPPDLEATTDFAAPAAAEVALRLTAPALPGEIGGSYFGNVLVTEPVTIALQVLNLNLWRADQTGAFTGTVNAVESSLYSAGIRLVGSTAGDTFRLSSEPYISTVSGRQVTQTFTMDGHLEDGGDVLKADYTGTITNLLPAPILVQGTYSASRPTAVSERLQIVAEQWSLQPGEGSTVTATLLGPTMLPITETRPITFTADLGTVVPSVTSLVDGVAVASFTAGDTEGLATVWATTGVITGVARIQVDDRTAPDVRFEGTPLSGAPPLEVTFTDLSSGGPTDWLWDFGDGDASAEQHPTHVYGMLGSYTVTLTVSDTQGSSYASKPAYVTVEEPPVPGTCIDGWIELQGRDDHGGVDIAVDGTPSATTATDGTFLACGLSPGPRTVTATRDLFLSVETEHTVIADTTTSLPDTVLAGGDTDGNDRVDLYDLVLVGANYGMEPPDDPRADLNEDGAVDLYDLTLIASNYDRQGPLPFGFQLTSVADGAAVSPDSDALAAAGMSVSGSDESMVVFARRMPAFYGFELQINYDPDAMEVLDALEEPGTQVQPGESWAGDGSGFVATNTADIGSGTIRVAATRLNPSSEVDGDIVLVTIPTRRKQGGSSTPVSIGRVTIVDRRGESLSVAWTDLDVVPTADPATEQRGVYLPLAQNRSGTPADSPVTREVAVLAAELGLARRVPIQASRR